MHIGTKWIEDDAKINYIKRTIDLIIIEVKQKHILQNASIYRGTVSDNDHN